MSLVKRGRGDLGDETSTVRLVHHENSKAAKVRIDKQAVKENTLRRLLSAGEAYQSVLRKAGPLEVEKILCESCHKRAYPAEASPSYSGNLVGECRFCSRRALCVDCWSTCRMCRMEACSLCSVKDYSQKDTAAVCLDCHRHNRFSRR